MPHREKTFKISLSASYPFTGDSNVTTTQFLRLQGNSLVEFNTSGVAVTGQGDSTNLGIYKTVVNYGDGTSETFESSLNENLTFSTPPSTFFHEYTNNNIVLSGQGFLGTVKFHYINGNTTTINLSTFYTADNLIEMQPIIVDSNTFFYNLSSNTSFNFLDHNSKFFTNINRVKQFKKPDELTVVTADEQVNIETILTDTKQVQFQASEEVVESGEVTDPGTQFGITNPAVEEGGEESRGIINVEEGSTTVTITNPGGEITVGPGEENIGSATSTERPEEDRFINLPTPEIVLDAFNGRNNSLELVYGNLNQKPSVLGRSSFFFDEKSSNIDLTNNDTVAEDYITTRGKKDYTKDIYNPYIDRVQTDASIGLRNLKSRRIFNANFVEGSPNILHLGNSVECPVAFLSKQQQEDSGYISTDDGYQGIYEGTKIRIYDESLGVYKRLDNYNNGTPSTNIGLNNTELGNVKPTQFSNAIDSYNRGYYVRSTTVTKFKNPDDGGVDPDNTFLKRIPKVFSFTIDAVYVLDGSLNGTYNFVRTDPSSEGQISPDAEGYWENQSNNKIKFTRKYNNETRTFSYELRYPKASTYIVIDPLDISVDEYYPWERLDNYGIGLHPGAFTFTNSDKDLTLQVQEYRWVPKNQLSKWVPANFFCRYFITRKAGEFNNGDLISGVNGTDIGTVGSLRGPYNYTSQNSFIGNYYTDRRIEYLTALALEQVNNQDFFNDSESNENLNSLYVIIFQTFGLKQYQYDLPKNQINGRTMRRFGERYTLIKEGGDKHNEGFRGFLPSLKHQVAIFKVKDNIENQSPYENIKYNKTTGQIVS